jgi:hypothetical protein
MARFCSPCSGANLRRLAFPWELWDVFRFPAATRFPRARLVFRSEIAAAAPVPADGYPDRQLASPRTGTPGLSHAERPRPAAYIWQAVPKEVTPCRTSREGQSGRTS